MVLVALEVILPTTMTCSGGNEEVDSIPHEHKRRGKHEKRWCNAGVVVQMFDGMHAQAREGLNIRVTVVQRVNVFIECLDVNKAVSEIEVQLSPNGDEKTSCNEHEQVPVVARI